jgi:hypothetical protein
MTPSVAAIVVMWFAGRFVSLKRPDRLSAGLPTRSTGGQPFEWAWVKIQPALGLCVRGAAQPGRVADITFVRLRTRDKSDVIEDILRDATITSRITAKEAAEISALTKRFSSLNLKCNKIVRAVWGLIRGKWHRVYILATQETYSRVTGRHPKDQRFRAKNIFSVGDLIRLTRQLDELIKRWTN